MRRSTGFFTVVAGAVLALILVPIIWVAHSRSPHSTTPTAVPTDEEKSYPQYIAVTNARVSVAENFLGHTVTYLDANVSNHGEKTVRELALQLEFQDTLSQVVRRETVRPITPRTPPLRPGQTVPVRLSFEQIPPDWNQAPPTITPVLTRF